jgi:hypothetical protein
VPIIEVETPPNIGDHEIQPHGDLFNRMDHEFHDPDISARLQ